MLSEEEVEQMSAIFAFDKNKNQPPKVAFKKVNKKKMQKKCWKISSKRLLRPP